MDPGHLYQLRNLDVGGPPYCTYLQFVKREGDRYPGNIGTRAGPISQEVVRALIDRAIYINAQIPAWQTRLSVWLFRAVLWLYEHRAAKRHGLSLPWRTFRRIEQLHPCWLCGHVVCDHSKT